MSTYAPPRLSRRALFLVVALHAAALVALARTGPISVGAPRPLLSVSLLTTTPAPAAPPKSEAPPPARTPPTVRPPTPLVAEAPATPASPAFAAPAPPPEAPAPAPASVPVAAPPAPSAPLAPTPPRFDANYLDNPKPVYPALSRRLGEEGRVLLRVRVGPNGLPQNVDVQTSSGSPRLDLAAVDTVRRWQFVAARLGDEAIAASVLVPIVFSLKE